MNTLKEDYEISKTYSIDIFIETFKERIKHYNTPITTGGKHSLKDAITDFNYGTTNNKLDNIITFKFLGFEFALIYYISPKPVNTIATIFTLKRELDYSNYPNNKLTTLKELDFSISNEHNSSGNRDYVIGEKKYCMGNGKNLFFSTFFESLEGNIYPKEGTL